MYVENSIKKAAPTLTSTAAFPDYQPHRNGDECTMSLQPNAGSVNIETGEFPTNLYNDITHIDARQYVAIPDMRKAAIWYAKRFGWHIFPLRPGTKEPFKDLGVYSATNDLDQIRSWWQRWPRANIGLHCGGSGILMLDADAYKETYRGTGLTQAEQQTVTAISGSGQGEHYYYAMPADVRLGNTTGKLPPGVDIRGWGGYVVLPPSLHPSGGRYTWELDYGPHEIPLAPLPASLWEILRSHSLSGGKVEKVHQAKIAQAVALVERALEILDIQADGPVAYMTEGRRWALGSCPFMPDDDPHDDDRGPFVIVLPDGRITAGCQHNRCRQEIAKSGLSGWKLLRQRAGLGAGAWHDAAIDALMASIAEVA